MTFQSAHGQGEASNDLFLLYHKNAVIASIQLLKTKKPAFRLAGCENMGKIDFALNLWRIFLLDIDA